MPIKTTYTESEVKDYMERSLGDTSRKLGWTAEAGDFDEPALEVLYFMGEPDYTFVDTATDAAKVRAVARMEAWRFAMFSTAHEASHSVGAPGTGTTNRADVHRHCKDQFELSKEWLEERYPDLVAEPARQVGRYSVEYTDDYYGNAND